MYKLSIGAACALEWPAERFVIQVLDDSTDPVVKVPLAGGSTHGRRPPPPPSSLSTRSFFFPHARRTLPLCSSLCPCPIGRASLTYFFPFCILQRPPITHMHEISCDMSLSVPPFFPLPGMCRESFSEEEKKNRQVGTGGAH